MNKNGERLALRMGQGESMRFSKGKGEIHCNSASK